MEKKSFCSPLSKRYWSGALKEVKSVRMLAFAALMIAAYVLLGMVFVPVGESLRITFKFVASALIGLVCGPVVGLGAGIIGDNIAFLLFPTGIYFPGYTLSAALSFFVFGLLLYKQKITLWRVLLAKAIINFGINVGLGVLWSSILLGKGYMFYFGTSLFKNTIMLPIEVILLMILLKALKPMLQKLKLIPME